MARRFVFSLQPVLELREREERERQLVVAEIERRCRGVEERIRVHQEGIASAKESIRRSLSSDGAGVNGRRAVDLGVVRQEAAASLQAMGMAQQAVFELAGLHKRLEDARTDLVRASAARRAVEILRDRQHEAWRAEVERAEASELDDLAVMRRSMQENGRMPS